MLALAFALVAFDFQNLLSLWWGKVLVPNGDECLDFTIVVPLFGHPRYFDRRDQLAGFRGNVLVAIEVGPPEMAAFADELEQEGWRVCRIRAPRPNPASLLKAALAKVTTTYVLRLDADSQIDIRLPQAVAAVAASGAELCSAKIAAANANTIAAKLQALEYRIAMLSRHFRPWMTSGACFIGRTEAMCRIFDQHSLWSPGEDIETGRVAHALRMKIRHVDYVVKTDVPDTWRALFRQRRLWWAGAFRHTVVNCDRNLLHLPILTAYLLAALWSSLYFRWWEAIDWRSLPTALPLLFVVYAVVTLVSNLQIASPWMLVFPVYSLLQLMLLPPLGALYYVLLAGRNRGLGRYRFGFRRPRRAARVATASCEPMPQQPVTRRRFDDDAPTSELEAWASALRAAA